MGIEIGQKAPDFQVANQAGEEVRLVDFQGKWLVLYFYPKDSTPGCTTEAIEFSQSLVEFAALNAEIVGVSPDSCQSHLKFIAKQNLSIALLADIDRQLAEAYGVWQLKQFMGKEYMGVVRSTFLIDPDGKIAHIWPKVKVKGHVADVLKQLTSIQE
jgi:thioredoxin-dependent peroxiredoxin